MIRVLRSQCSQAGAGALESRYGSAGPTKALQALQRDGLLLHSQGRKDDVYEKPMAAVMSDYLILNDKSHQQI